MNAALLIYVGLLVNYNGAAGTKDGLLLIRLR